MTTEEFEFELRIWIISQGKVNAKKGLLYKLHDWVIVIPVAIMHHLKILAGILVTIEISKQCISRLIWLFSSCYFELL